MKLGHLNRRQFIRCAGSSALAGWLSAHSSAAEPRTVKFVLQFGKPGHGPGEFDSPVSIAIDAQDRLHVTDFLNKRVQIFTTEGKFLSELAVPPYPGGLTLDNEGLIYVAHWNDSRIGVYSPKGELVRQWGTKGTGDGEFQLVGGLAMSRDQTLYAADQGNSRIQAFTREGKFLRKWGSLGGGDGQFGIGKEPGSRFAGPQFLTVDESGHVYATDIMRGRVQKFTAAGEFVLGFGSNSTEPGGFGGRKVPVEGPIALCVDRAGRIWVGASNHLVQLFSPTGEYLVGMGGGGHTPGKFDTPHGLAIDSQGFLYAVDTMNGRVQKFAVT